MVTILEAGIPLVEWGDFVAYMALRHQWPAHVIVDKQWQPWYLMECYHDWKKGPHQHESA